MTQSGVLSLESNGVKNQTRSRVLLLVGLFLTCGAVAAHDDESRGSPASSRVPLPVHNVAPGEQCVDPIPEMRRNHMEKILHHRDQTMHEGIRTTKYSLKNCVNCHADPKTNSVLGKDGFCASCHQYAAVSIDCFSCHSDKREPKAAEATPASAARALSPVAEGTRP